MSEVRPNSLVRALAAIGPGMVVAGSVMGSGELINTPAQAAKFGFILLWSVLLSCVIKYLLQVEIARYCLVTNRTTVEALNQCPGPKFRNTSWTALLYMAGYFATMTTVVGIVGALGGLMHGIWPLAATVERSVQIWEVLLVVLTIALLWQGLYRHLELSVALLVGGFSISIGFAVFLIQWTPYRISGDQLMSGLTFSLGDNREAAAFAVISLMGALGVAANELFMYPYWILEKGYARELGDPASAGWAERARQWIRIIWIDAGFATVLATVMTAAFYLLGAAVLHREHIEPQGLEVVDQISKVYTESFGQWSKIVYVFGAFCVLYSTLVVVAAASGRMWADLFGSLGLLDGGNPQAVKRCHQVVQTVWLVGILAWALATSAPPAQLVMLGHFILGAFMTPLLMCCICWLAFHTDRRVRMGPLTAVGLVGSVVIILACVLVNLAVQLGEKPKVAEPAAAAGAAAEAQP
jgi:Mn2+/Fe2+ NRAMP family transporter